MVDVLISMIEGCVRYSGESDSHIVHVGWHKQDDGPVFFTRCDGKGGLEDLSLPFKLLSGGEGEDDSTLIALAVSKMIIELQGGRMWIECGPELGCTILFTLPEGKDA
jgi:light-regulated signal transduction histidine kinase (bacteriophytochrome)